LIAPVKHEQADARRPVLRHPMLVSEDEEIAESVQRHGWHAIAVEGTASEAPFIYTIGLCDKFEHPELVIVGLPSNVAHSLLADVVKAIRTGQQYRPGETYRDLIQGYEVTLLRVHRSQVLCRLGYALAYYRRASRPELLRALQILWPDRAGRLPNDPSCDRAVAQLQPLLDHEVSPSDMRAFMARFGTVSN
jgi:hypothetical protein